MSQIWRTTTCSPHNQCARRWRARLPARPGAGVRPHASQPSLSQPRLSPLVFQAALLLPQPLLLPQLSLSMIMSLLPNTLSLTPFPPIRPPSPSVVFDPNIPSLLLPLLLPSLLHTRPLSGTGGCCRGGGGGHGGRAARREQPQRRGPGTRGRLKHYTQDIIRTH